jgi:DNA-binding CsgD family transcriptional regulator/predicted ABC-type transport system involved in lysophospholipase L1 biosynthesis ATPase subunit
MIEARDLTKRYGPTVAVDALSFDVRAGSVTGFLRPNGSGKSTTMRLILGLDRPDAGQVRVGGRCYRELRWPLREVGALLEASAFHPGRSARSHLAALAASSAIPRARVDEVLDMVGLASAAERRAGMFSLGMGQRLGVAARAAARGHDRRRAVGRVSVAGGRVLPAPQRSGRVPGEHGEGGNVMTTTAGNRVPSGLAALTARERRVLALMAEGRSNAAIASALVVTGGTVEKHVAGIFDKLGCPRARPTTAASSRSCATWARSPNVDPPSSVARRVTVRMILPVLVDAGDAGGNVGGTLDVCR